MTDHTLLVVTMGFFAALAVLVILGLLLREARRDSRQLAQTLAQIETMMDAMIRRLG
jgi:sensor domain CHASE-containing protein